MKHFIFQNDTTLEHLIIKAEDVTEALYIIMISNVLSDYSYTGCADKVLAIDTNADPKILSKIEQVARLCKLERLVAKIADLPKAPNKSKLYTDIDNHIKVDNSKPKGVPLKECKQAIDNDVNAYKYRNIFVRANVSDANGNISDKFINLLTRNTDVINDKNDISSGVIAEMLNHYYSDRTDRHINDVTEFRVSNNYSTNSYKKNLVILRFSDYIKMNDARQYLDGTLNPVYNDFKIIPYSSATDSDTE